MTMVAPKIADRSFAGYEYTLKDFAKFCRRLILENGKPMSLEPFQKTMLEGHFGDAVELVIVISKKNGKTTLLAALALYHLLIVREAEIVICASSELQAKILFRQAVGLIRRSDLEDWFEIKSGFGEIRLTDDRNGPKMRVLAADAKGADGVLPTLALVDELHRHPSGDMYGVFRDGLDARDGKMITISTAGSRIDSPLGELRSKAHALPIYERDAEDMHTYASSEDGSFVLREWSLDPSDDVDDMSVVKKANPASWQTEAKLRRRHDSPSTTPWQWKRFACGIWTEGEEPWLEPRSWDDLADPELELEPLEAVWLGVDIGVRHDSTGIALVAERDGILAVTARIIPPPPQGSLPLQKVEQTIRDLCQEFTVQGVAYDPWSFRRSAEMLQDEGINMLEFPQSPERMAEASGTLYRLIESKTLVHDGDPQLRSHVLAGITKNTERGWRLTKAPKDPRSIDALIALAMACYVSVGSSPFVLT